MLSLCPRPPCALIEHLTRLRCGPVDPALHLPLSARRGPLPALGSHGPTWTSSSRSPTADHRRRRCAPSLKPIRHHRRPRDDHCNRCRRLRPRRRVALASVTAIAAIHSTALVAASSSRPHFPIFRLASKAPIATTAIAATACVATFNRPFANPSPPLSPSPPSPPPSPRCRPHHRLPMPASVTAASILASALPARPP